MERILLIQLRSLGDTLLATPVLRQLQRLHPGASIEVLSERGSFPILEANRRVSRLWDLPRRTAGGFLRTAWQLRRRRYHLVVDCQSLPKTALLTRLTGAPRRLGFRRPWLRNRVCYTHPYSDLKPEYSVRHKLRLLRDTRVDLDDLELEFPVSEQACSAAEEFGKRYFRPPVAAVYAVSRFSYKQWPVNKCAALADRLAGAGYQPFLIHAPGQEAGARAVAEAMRRPALVDYPAQPLPVFKEVLSRCSLFVGNDGGPRHIAGVGGVPSVAIFWMSRPQHWTPPHRRDQRFVAIRGDGEPSEAVGTFTDADDVSGISVDAVWQEIESMAREGYVKLPPSRAQAPPA